jgi:hemerythrin superfamily protein
MLAPGDGAKIAPNCASRSDGTVSASDARSSPGVAMKATILLERQHRNLQQLCEAVERGSARVRESLLPQLAGDLVAHFAVEEQLFYPAVCAALHEDALARSDKSRHAEARLQLERVLAVSVEDDDGFAAAIGALRDVVERHAEEEEEVLFPQLEGALDSGAMRELGLSMMSLYHAKVEAGYSSPEKQRPLRPPPEVHAHGR